MSQGGSRPPAPARPRGGHCRLPAAAPARLPRDPGRGRRPGARDPDRAGNVGARRQHGAARRRRRNGRRPRRRPARLAGHATDLPGRGLWAAAAALPLVIPSYVAAFCLLGFFGPRGLLAEALGVERLPDVTGYWGAARRAHVVDLPVRLPARPCSARGHRSCARGGGTRPRRLRAQGVRRVTVPALRPAGGLGALLVALYTLSDFGVVSLMRYDALTRAIYVQYRSLFDRAPAAMLALVLVALTAVALALEYRMRQRGRAYRTSPGAARRASRSHWDVGAGPHSRSAARASGSSSSFRQASSATGSRAGSPTSASSPSRGSDARLARGVEPGRGHRRHRGAPRRVARAALPLAAVATAGAALLRRERAARAS